MQRLILIGLAGSAGTLMRYWLSDWTARRYGETFPTGTLVVNLIGCFLAGLLFYLMFDRYLYQSNGAHDCLDWAARRLYDVLFVWAANVHASARRRVWRFSILPSQTSV